MKCQRLALLKQPFFLLQQSCATIKSGRGTDRFSDSHLLPCLCLSILTPDLEMRWTLPPSSNFPSFIYAVTDFCQSHIRVGREIYIGGGIHHFRHVRFQMQHMHRHKHLPLRPPESCPCLFSDLQWGEHRVSAVLTSSPSPLRSSSKSLSGWSHGRLTVSLSHLAGSRRE